MAILTGGDSGVNPRQQDGDPGAARTAAWRRQRSGGERGGNEEGKYPAGSFGSLPFVRRYNRVGRAANEIVWCRLVASNTTMIRRVKIAGGETTGRSDVRRLE